MQEHGYVYHHAEGRNAGSGGRKIMVYESGRRKVKTVGILFMEDSMGMRDKDREVIEVQG
jgi:hypothetical protein